MPATLTPKQTRFVAEYLIDLNATAAAIRAGYSARTAESAGSRLLRNVKVQAAISAAQQARAKRTEIDADWVLRTLAEEKAADLADLFDEAGNMRPVNEWPIVFRRGLVVGIESFEEYAQVDGQRVPVGMVRKFKITDRVKHLELIGKHVRVGAFRTELTGPGGGPIQTVSMTPEEFRKIAAEMAEKL